MPRRARSDADKELRRAAILDAAGEVFDRTGIDDFTMDEVAASLALAKGTLYRYVPTREGLLLAVIAEEYRNWFDAVDALLAVDPSGRGAPDVATLLVDSLLERPRMLRLLSLMSSVLERNVPRETAHEFKSFLLTRTTTTAGLLAQRLDCPQAEAVRLLVHLQAVTVGLHHHAHPSPVVAEVLADPSLAAFAIDLRTELLHAVQALVAAARR